MPECRRPVEAPGQITAQLCDVEIEPPEVVHLGPCANQNLPQTVARREEFFAERERQHRIDQARLEELGSAEGKPSWESMSGDPMGGPPQPRRHPQDLRREAEQRALAEARQGGIAAAQPGSLESLPDQVNAGPSSQLEAPGNSPSEWDLAPPEGRRAASSDLALDNHLARLESDLTSGLEAVAAIRRIVSGN